MEISIAKTNSEIHVKITGSIKNSDERALKQTFDEIIVSHEKVILDLKFVPIICSLGISRIYILYKELSRQKREFIIDGIHKDVYSLFTSMEMDKFLPIKNT